jgi:hypothetical protein
MITTESGSQFRHWGQYMTNFGSTLGAVMYGFAGVQPADDLTVDIARRSARRATVRNTPLFEQFIHKNDQFTKTGSGQT